MPWLRRRRVVGRASGGYVIPADKLAHAALSFLFVLCGALWPTAWGWPAVVALVIGAGREIAQWRGWLAGHAEWGDMAADVAGVSLAVAWLFLSGFPA